MLQEPCPNSPANGTIAACIWHVNIHSRFSFCNPLAFAVDFSVEGTVHLPMQFAHRLNAILVFNRHAFHEHGFHLGRNIRTKCGGRLKGIPVCLRSVSGCRGLLSHQNAVKGCTERIDIGPWTLVFSVPVLLNRGHVLFLHPGIGQ